MSSTFCPNSLLDDIKTWVSKNRRRVDCVVPLNKGASLVRLADHKEPRMAIFYRRHGATVIYTHGLTIPRRLCNLISGALEALPGA